MVGVRGGKERRGQRSQDRENGGEKEKERRRERERKENKLHQHKVEVHGQIKNPPTQTQAFGGHGDGGERQGKEGFRFYWGWGQE